jgi:hypothetical protein
MKLEAYLVYLSPFLIFSKPLAFSSLAENMRLTYYVKIHFVGIFKENQLKEENHAVT